MDSKKLMTEVTRKKLNETSLSTIEEVTVYVDKLHRLLKDIDTFGIYSDPHTVKKLYEYKMLLQVLNLDLSTSVRIYLNAKSNYESIFSGRQIRVVVVEGLKNIYAFKEPYRRKTFWVKDIGAIVEKNIILQPDYNRITQKIENYMSMYHGDLTIKNQRDLSIHYHEDVSKVYEMLVETDIGKICKMMIPFGDILADMIVFTQKGIDSYHIK